MPSWQTEPCPSWCRLAPHVEDEQPDDRMHAGPERNVPLPLMPPVNLCTGTWTTEHTNAYLWQHVREVEACVILHVGESNEGFTFSLDNAEAVARDLLALVAQARAGL